MADRGDKGRSKGYGSKKKGMNPFLLAFALYFQAIRTQKMNMMIQNL